MVAALCFGFFLLGLALGAFGRSWLRDRSLEAANRKMKRGGVMQPTRAPVARVEPLSSLDPLSTGGRETATALPERSVATVTPDEEDDDLVDGLLAPVALRLPERPGRPAFHPEATQTAPRRSSLSFRPPA